MCNKHVHSTMTRSSGFHCLIGVLNKPTTVELCISPVYRRLAVAKLSKVADFDPPHLHFAPPQWVIPVEFRGDLWHQKTRVTGLSCGVVCVILCLAALVELRLVTDRQTDRHRPMASTADA